MFSRLKPPFNKSTFWVMNLVLLTYLIIIVTYIGRYDMNLSSLIFIGNQDPHFAPHKINPGYLVYHHGGYDGQYNYYIVKDFFLKGNFSDPFRYQRILYPLLVSILSFGNSTLIPIVFVLLNLLSIWLGMYILMKLLGNHSEMNIFLLVLFGLNIGFLVAILYDLGTPLAIALILLGILFYHKENFYLSALCLGLSLLTMENAWLVITPLVLWNLYHKDFNKSLKLCLSVLPWLLWQFVLYFKFGHLPIFLSAGFLSFPFKGIIDYIHSNPLHASSAEDLIRQLDIIPMLLFVFSILIISGIQLYRHKSLYAFIVLFHAVFALFLSYQHIWAHTITSSSRVLCGLFPFIYLLFDQADKKRLLTILLVFSWLLTMLGLFRLAFLPHHPYTIL